jgi:hypothetical protein
MTAKDKWDVLLQVLTMGGAGLAFVIGLRQWRRDQAWKRAERMDQFVAQFEQDKLLQLAATILDWTYCSAEISGKEIDVENNEVLLALRDHSKMGPNPVFKGNQMKMRRAYDALLSFFSRLEMALTMDLIDVEPDRQYFGYWLKRLVTFDRHSDDENVLGGTPPTKIVEDYIRVYGDPKSMARLRKHFGCDGDAAS